MTDRTSWSHLFNFTEGQQGWTIYSCNHDCGNGCNVGNAGIYSGGQFNSVTFPCSGQRLFTAFRIFAVADISTVRVIGSTTIGLGTAGASGVAVIAGTFVERRGVSAGAFDETFVVNQSGITRIDLGASDFNPAISDSVVTQIIVTGIGINPFLKQVGPADCACGVYASADSVMMF
jgi:hypothetical protein